LVERESERVGRIAGASWAQCTAAACRLGGGRSTRGWVVEEVRGLKAKNTISGGAGQAADTGGAMTDTQKRPHDIRDPSRFVVGGAAEYHEAIVNPTVTSLGARGAYGGSTAKEAVEEEDAEAAATEAGSGGMFPGLQPSARGGFELNGGHKLRAAMRGQTIDTQVGTTPWEMDVSA